MPPFLFWLLQTKNPKEHRIVFYFTGYEKKGIFSMHFCIFTCTETKKSLWPSTISSNHRTPHMVNKQVDLSAFQDNRLEQLQLLLKNFFYGLLQKSYLGVFNYWWFRVCFKRSFCESLGRIFKFRVKLTLMRISGQKFEFLSNFIFFAVPHKCQVQNSSNE